MQRFQAETFQGLAAAVGAVEARSGLEVVVRVQARSGSYGDVGYATAIVVGLVTLCCMVYLPFEVSAAWLVPEVAATGGLAGWLVVRTPWLLRALTRRERRERQLLDAARACFVTHAVSGTRDRTGVLLYVGLLEDRVLVLPDFGAEGAAAQAEWAAVRRAANAEGALVSRVFQTLEGLGALGEAHVPRRADDRNELPDEPSFG